jgi:Zn-dependent protease with chaperone function
MPDRIPLPQISSISWEHPADRAALNTLRAIPGFDEIVRKIAGFFGERGVRYLFLANAVRVGPRQRPRLDAIMEEVLTTLDWNPGPTGRRPQLYVTQSPVVNAAAVGFDEPFIVMHSAMLDLLDDEELRFILAHELGHIMSGHTTYRTIALIFLTIGLGSMPFLAGLALLPFQLALLEWYRKAELSCDRAGLLGTQDPRACMTSFLKMAGGAVGVDHIDLDDFLVQAAEYESPAGPWDSVLKVINTAMRDHPFNTVRAAELQRWIQGGGYDRILRAEYQRRGSDDDRPLRQDYSEAATYYGGAMKDVAGTAATTLGDAASRARDAFNQKFRGPR